MLLSKLREKVRRNRGQKSEASLGIMDSQSVRWGNNRSLNGFDRGKKVKGIKRHVMVDKKEKGFESIHKRWIIRAHFFLV
ncbi:hypothetical protein A0O34_20370 [Chryseobacterium glaciei]|uniref:Transposase IS4-like domain-containing protein n=2 Tax=Chryseobacterium glaciei TaxID=1685010 RepID=A0A172Y0D5_9FLAO|nr:hypothetical protein A0O34_20370 [Chryseobacterium glaciei]